MTLAVPNSAEILMLQYLLNMASPGNQLLHLFKNDLTPGEATVGGGVTEATEAGYAIITLTGAGWTVAQDAGTTTGMYSEQTFTFTTGATLYGYYVTTLAGDLLWVERFSGAPYQLPVGGGEIAVTPQINLD